MNHAPPAMVDLYADLAATPVRALPAAAKAVEEKDVVYLLETYRRRFSDLPRAARAAAWEEERLLERVVKARGKPTPVMRAELAHARARLWHDDPKHARDAIAAYREAAALYLELDNPLEGIVCLNNAASVLAGAERDDEALAQVAAIKEIIARERAAAKTPQVAAHLELEEVFPTGVAARIAKRRGQYREIIAMLTPLVDRYAQTGVTGGREKEMELLELIASAHAKLGEEDAAAAIYERIAKRAAELRDVARQRSVAYSVGDLYYDRARYAEALASFDRSATMARAAGDQREEARGLAAAGQALWALGRRAEALEKHAAALKLREAVGDDSGIAWQLVQVSKIQVEVGDREAARAALDRALTLRRALGEQSGEAEVHAALGDLLLAQTQPAEAERELAAARDIYHRLKLGPDEANALRRLASARLLLGDAPGADKLIEAAAELFERGGDRLSRIWTLIWQSRIKTDLGQLKQARALLAPLAPKDPDADPGVAVDLLCAEADLDFAEGLADAATAKAERATQLAEKANDVRRRIDAISRLRRARAVRGDYEGALASERLLLELAKSSGNRPAEVDALQQLAWTSIDLGRLADAKQAVDEALPIARANADLYAEAWALNTRSRVFQAYGDAAGELRDLNEALTLMETVNYPYGRAAMVFNRALLYARLRDVDRALADYDLAEKIGGASLDSNFRLSLASARGEALLRAGSLAAAEKALRAALPRARTEQPAMVADFTGLLALTLSGLGRHDEAVAMAEEAVRAEAAKVKGGTGAAAGTLGRVLARAGRDAEARVALASSIDLARSRGGALPWEALYDLAVIASKAGEVKPAIGFLQDAVKEIERGEVVLAEGSVARYHGDKVEVFRLLVKLLLQDGQTEAAFQFLERGKVAELRDLDRRLGSGDDPTTALAIELDVQEKKLQRLLDAELAAAAPDERKIAQLDGLLGAAKKKRAAFMESLDRNDALFDRYAVRPLQLEKLQQYLGDGVLVVAPVVLDDSVVVFAMTKDALTHFSTPIGGKEVDELVQGFVRTVDPRSARGVKGRATLAKATAQARRLYDLFLRPAIDAMGVPRTLVVSPTGSLRYLPFAALHDGKGWLVERTAVVNVTALDREKFATASPRGSADLSVMALVDPDGTLPSARTELAQVQKVLANVDVFEGKDASAETLRHKVRVPGYDVVHFATHGRLDAKNPELSNILLADAALSYADIPTLAPKKTQLVVLSACQTAVLSGGSGVEIAGLAFKFQQLRVHSVLATLWEVDDAATADFMASFYGALRGGESYAAALADAQRGMIAAGGGLEHPAYWAPFILMGTP
ncbi:MAG: CHAT domain-containing protein [Myxococcales bacterium]|nr:CHAT domain-containing protein [Myxococcales bacterium]